MQRSSSREDCQRTSATSRQQQQEDEEKLAEAVSTLSVSAEPQPPLSPTPPDNEPRDHQQQQQQQMTGASPSPAPSTPPAASVRHEHHVKWVSLLGARQPLITQSENGPCPLLALINAMLLRGKLQLPPTRQLLVPSERLLELVANLLVDGAALTDQQQHQQQQLQAEQEHSAHRGDLERNVEDALVVLPKLLTGLDVNVQFTGVCDFEYTPECVIFDLLNVPLYHGWLLDPSDRERRDVIGTCGYNRLVEMVISNKQSDDPSLVHKALVAEEFLSESASQLTDYGLCQLTDTLADGEVAVLFRNNHFSTIYKFRDALYSLVTDQGFLSETDIVWETLVSPRSATHFVDGQFQSLSSSLSDEAQQSSGQTLPRTDSDLALLMQSKEFEEFESSEVQPAREAAAAVVQAPEQLPPSAVRDPPTVCRPATTKENKCSVM